MPILLYEILGELKKMNKLLEKHYSDADDKQAPKEAKKPKGGKDSKQGSKTSSLPTDGMAETETVVPAEPSAM